MKFKIIYLLFTFLLLCNCQSSQCQLLSDTTVTVKKQRPISTATVTDIDGHQYKTVKIGTQIWMAENLNVSHFRNGDSISGVIDDCDAFRKFGLSQKPAWSKYTWPMDKNLNDNDKKLVLLNRYYNWYAIQDTRGLAPKGWHIPNDSDWEILINYLGGSEKAGPTMRSTWGWAEICGTNKSGFNGLPAGFVRDNCDAIQPAGIGFFGNWWSTSAGTPEKPTHVYSTQYSDFEFRMNDTLAGPIGGAEVRCVKD